MRGLKNEIIKPTYDMKKLILLLFIPLVFACSDDEDTPNKCVDETLISSDNDILNLLIKKVTHIIIVVRAFNWYDI